MSLMVGLAVVLLALRLGMRVVTLFKQREVHDSKAPSQQHQQAQQPDQAQQQPQVRGRGGGLAQPRPGQRSEIVRCLRMGELLQWNGICTKRKHACTHQ